MSRLSTVMIAMGSTFLLLGCPSNASYQVMQKGTWQIGTAAEKQPTPPIVLQTVTSDAPGGQAAIVVVYFGANNSPIVEAKGDSSALVNATAAVGRRAFDLAIRAARVAATH